MKTPLLVALLAMQVPHAFAEVECPPVFAPRMVLQLDQAVPDWGTAAPGEKVKVEFAGKSAAATADGNGVWTVLIGPFPANSKGQALVVNGGNELRFDDVLVGEVWLCSRQSNMEKPLGERNGRRPTDNAAEEIRNANHPLIRLFQMPRNGRPQKNDLTIQRHPCTPETVNNLNFSAAGYFFGREVQSKLGIRVGLIHTSMGGS